MKGTIGSLFVLGGALQLSAVADAQTTNRPECTDAILNGSCGVLHDGVVFGEDGHLAEVAVVTFDGKGHWTLDATLVRQGFSARLASGDAFRAQRWLFGVLRDLVFFAPFLAAGWIYRRRPEIHKRLMIVATAILVLPAVSRMTFLGTPVPLWKFMLVWPVPVYIAIIHDFRTQKLVHPVYVIGIVAMLTMRLVLPLGSSRAWQALAAHITAIYQTQADEGR